MNLDQLEYIIEVAKSGSLSVASKKLHVTQSALSQSITNLETELGVKIFNRSRMGAIPTVVGRQMIKKAYEALAKLEEIREEAGINSSLINGELRIGTIPGTAMFLPRVLSAYKKDFPQIQIQVTEKSSQNIINDIKQDFLDIGLIGLTREGKEKEDDNMDLEVVLRGKMIVAVSKQSPLAFSRTITPQELRTHPLVIYNDDRMWEFVDDFASQFGPVNIFFSTNNMDAIRNAVYENLAITIGPDYTIRNEPLIMAGEGVPLEISELVQDYPGMALVWPKAKRNLPILKHFILKLKSQMMEVANSS